MEIQARKQIGHRLGATDKQGQEPARKVFLHTPYPRPRELHRPTAKRELTRFPITVAIPARAVYAHAAFRFLSP